MFLQIWDYALKKFANLPCVGTRRFKGSIKETQPDGRIFEKVTFNFESVC